MPAFVTVLLVVLFGGLFMMASVLAGVDTRDGRDWQRTCENCTGIRRVA